MKRYILLAFDQDSEAEIVVRTDDIKELKQRIVIYKMVYSHIIPIDCKFGEIA